MRRLSIGLLSLALLVTGCFGSWSYAHNYYLYRGFAKPTDPPGIAHGRAETIRIWSNALHKYKSVIVYLPPGYAKGAAAGRRYPALYLLQASVGQASNYLLAGALNTRIDTLVHQQRIPPYITVMPWGHGPDHEWTNALGGNYMSYVREVVHAIDQRFSTQANRSGRAIAGLSEGGYGAINIALRNLSTFSTFESWSGYYTQKPGFPFASTAQRVANSPALYLSSLRAQLRRYPTRAFLYQGSHDDVPIPAMYSFARQLRSYGVPTTVAVYPGGHNWKLWRAHFTPMLIWAGRGFHA